MNIVKALPPNFAEIDAVIFAWGATIYNPAGIKIDAPLRAHEAVHGERQREYGGPAMWWRRYLAEPAFRLDEEIPAHQAEYRCFCSTLRALRVGEEPSVLPDRASRRITLHHIAARLASDLYGRLIRYDDARRLIKAAA